MAFILNDLEVYQISQKIGSEIWAEVVKWDSFAKHGIGRQFTNAADSIAANIAEGYGRFFIKENIHFCYYSRGSLLETITWLKKAHDRGLIGDDKFVSLQTELSMLHHRLNAYLKQLRNNAGNLKKPQ